MTFVVTAFFVFEFSKYRREDNFSYIVGVIWVMENLKRGQIVWVDFPEVDDALGTHVQCGRRPAIILSNNTANAKSPIISIAAITSRKKKPLPVHVPVKTKSCTLRQESTCLLEQMMTIDKSSIIGYIGDATDDCMRAIEKAIRIQLGMES